jgi:hypothetical protein
MRRALALGLGLGLLVLAAWGLREWLEGPKNAVDESTFEALREEMERVAREPRPGPVTLPADGILAARAARKADPAVLAPPEPAGLRLVLPRARRGEAPRLAAEVPDTH